MRHAHTRIAAPLLTARFTRRTMRARTSHNTDTDVSAFEVHDEGVEHKQNGEPLLFLESCMPNRLKVLNHLSLTIMVHAKL